MPLTRLDNLISSKTGKYLYVSPDDFNATDALSNRGNSPITPFKSIQRAFLEIARYSYLPGFGNDRFDQFSIMLMPGIHYIDNRPGLVDTSGIDVFGFDQALNAWTDNSILDISNPNNVLYKFNNTEGGAIIPRGSSLVGYDLRRTVVRPLYVPDPASVTIPRSAIFNVTGGCYFWQFTIKDGQTTAESPLYNPQTGSGEVYYDPNDFTRKTAPNFSHHKLTIFEYADQEELGIFYRKIAKAFSAYQPTIDDPGEFDFNIQENRIVGPLSDSRVIESLKLTDATTDPSIPASTAEIQVTTKTDHGYFQGQFVAISNTEIDDVLEGIFPIKEIDQNDPRKFTYEVPFVVSAIGTNIVSGQTISVDTTPALGQNAQTLAEVDSVESASPYVFNCSIRSTWGICGIWANGLKATGFKSMVIAQYTGVSLQKDDRAFIRYDEYSNTWNQASLTDAFATVPYHTKGDSYWKDDWRNFHVRASEDAFIQNVSIFAVGFADHFLMESGGDMSITNSNSNFGNTSLHAIGFKGFAFNQDKGGYITDIIPPQVVTQTQANTKKVQYYTIDIQGSIQDSSNYTKLFLGSDTIITPNERAAASISGFRLGAKTDEKLYVKLDPASAGGTEEFNVTLEPTGFVKYIAKASILNPSGVAINNVYADAANLIESNRRMIQEEVFGYILEKYPRLQNISYVNPGLNPAAGRYFDAKNLIQANRQEIVDTASVETITAYPTSAINTTDIGLLVDVIAEDLRDGGNFNTIEHIKEYFSGGLLSKYNGQQDEVVFAFNRTRDLCKKAIANLLTVKATIYDPDPNSILQAYGVVAGSTGSDALGLNSSGVTVDASNKEDPAGRYKDARDRIVANREFILDAALAEVAVYHPDFYMPGDTQSNAESRFADAYRLIRRNSKEIADRALAAIALNHPDFYFPGDAQTTSDSRFYDSYRLIQQNKDEIQDRALAQIAITYPDFYFPGDNQTTATSRFADSYRLIQQNRTYIIENSWANMVAAFPAVAFTEIKCKRDLGYFVDAISLDLFMGGNKYARKFVSMYFDGGAPIANGLVGEEAESIRAFQEARDFMRQAVANQLPAQDLTLTPDPLTGSNINPNSCADVQSAISTLTTIVTDVIANGSLSGLAPETAYTSEAGELKCRRDLGYFVDALSLDIFIRGNEYSYRFATEYFDANGAPISNGLIGEESQSIVAFNMARDMMKLAITNQLYAKDLTLTADPNTAPNNQDPTSCGDVQNAIDTLAGIVTTIINDGDLNSLPVEINKGSAPAGMSKCSRDIGYFIDAIGVDVFTGGNKHTRSFVQQYFTGNTPISNGLVGEEAESVTAFNEATSYMQLAVTNQLYYRDLTITPDPLTGNNEDPTSCADVRSAISNLSTIVTDAVVSGNLNSLPVENPGSFLVGETKCRRDIGYVVDAIAQDLWFGGNEYTIAATKEYFDGGILLQNGLDGEISPSITAFKRAADLMNRAVNNQYYDRDLTITLDQVGEPPVISDIHADAYNIILENKEFIAEEAYQRMLVAYPSYVPQLGNTKQDCLDDVYAVLEAVMYDVKFGGNSKTYDAANVYVTNTLDGEVIETFIDAERDEAARVFAEAKLIAISVMRNEPVAASAFNEYVQILDPTMVSDWDADSKLPLCSSAAGAIDSLFDIIIQAIGTDAGVGNLSGIFRTAPTQPTSYVPGNCSDVLATIDTLTGILCDALQAGSLSTLPPLSNGEWDCANVRSSIENLFDIVTEAIGTSSLSYLPNVNRGDFTVNNEASKCFRDVSYIVDALVQDLRLGGNINSIQVGEAYYIGNDLTYIDGEKTETIDAWNYVGQLATAAMRNFDFLAFNCSTSANSSIVDVGDTRGIVIGMRVAEYDNTDLVNPAYVNGLLQPGAQQLVSNIPADTYVKRIVSNTEIELGVRYSRFDTGTAVNALQTSTTTNLYFTFESGLWADTLPKTVNVGPVSSGPDVVQDTSTSPSSPECAGTADAIETLVGNITTIINSGLGTVQRQEQTVNTALLASRATVFTIDITGTGASNAHNFETGTPVRLVPRPRFNTATGEYVDVDKRLVRLPNGFDTNTTYYVIAPGRRTQPEDYSSTTFFNGTDQTKLMLATSKENAAAGIYIYSSETDGIDPNVEIDIYQFVLDINYDLHNYKCELTNAVNAGIETEISHIFDVPSAATTPHRVFFREIEGGLLPLVSTTYENDATVATTNPNDSNVGRINPNVEFYARYQNDKVFTIHKTHADAINNVNPITFASGQAGLIFDVFSNKRRSPMQFDPGFNDAVSNTGKWFINVKDEGSNSVSQSVREENILWRIHQVDYADRPKSTDMWFTRLDDTRDKDERTYKIRYVIPKYLENARDPINGFVLKTRTDDTRKLVPQKILLKPVAGTVYGARFENPVQAGEYIGYEDLLFSQLGLNRDAAYDPYKKDLTGSGIEYRAFARFSSGIQATIQSGRYVEDNLDPNIKYLELTLFDHTIDSKNFPGLRNEAFTTIKITAPQGGEFVVNKTQSIAANQVEWTGNSSGIANIHAYYSVGGDHYLIIKNIRGGKLEYSEFQNTRFTQGNVFADMLEDQDMGKSLPLKTLIRKGYPEYYYKQNGANVYTITPGDRIQDDAGIEYYVDSVADAGVIEDTFYVFSYETLQRRIAGQQDGIYYLSCLRGNISPFPTGAGVSTNFRNFKFSQPVSKLYPLNYKNDPLWFKYAGTTQEEKDYAAALIDPPAAYSAADNYVHGLVTVNDYKNSVTRETIIDLVNQPAFVDNTYTSANAIKAKSGNATSGSEDRRIPIAGDNSVLADQRYYVELRRPSIARAGNHTFEYLGFGPGNYSTGLPARQEIVLTPTQDFYAQSKKQDAGIVFYTGINSQGDLYIGNRRINAITGEEEFIDSAQLVDSSDDDEDIGALVTTFDTPVTFNQNITVVGGDGTQQNTFQSPIVISVQDNDLTQQRDTLIIRSNVSSIDPVTGDQQDESLDRTSFRPVTSGDIRISKNRIQAAIFGFNPRGNGQPYKIQTHITSGVPSNITPNNSQLIIDGGTRLNSTQFVTYNGVIPSSGDILLKGEEVGKSGSLGWIYSNYYTKIADNSIFTITFDGSNIVKLNWIGTGGTTLTNQDLGITSGSQIRVKNFYVDPRLNLTWSVFSPNGDAFSPSNDYVHFQVIDNIAAATLSWADVISGTAIGSPQPTIEFSSANWKEIGVLGAEAIRTETETIGDYKVGINTVARSEHEAHKTGFVDQYTQPRANLDVVGTAFISGKKINSYLAESTYIKTEDAQNNALLVGGDSAAPDDISVFRVMTTNGGRVGINTAINDIVTPSNNLDRNLVIVGNGRITSDFEITGDMEVNGGDITTTSPTFNFVTTDAYVLNLASEGQIINLGTNTSADQNINVGNNAGKQVVQIGNAASETTLRIHRNSNDAIVDIASVRDSAQNSCEITLGGAWSNTASFTKLETRQTLIAGELEIGTKYAPGTSISRIFTQTRTVNVFDGDQTNTVNFATNATTLTIGSTGGSSIIRNTLNVLASANVEGNIRLNGGLNSGIVTVERGRFATTIVPHNVGSVSNANVDFYKYESTGKVIDTQGATLWGGTQFLIAGGQIAGIDNITNNGEANRIPGTYTFLTTTGGTGTGATFTVVVRSDRTIEISIDSPGSGYTDDDLLTITNDQLGGGAGGGDLTFLVNGTNDAGSNYFLPITTPSVLDFRVGDLILIDRGDAASPDAVGDPLGGGNQITGLRNESYSEIVRVIGLANLGNPNDPLGYRLEVTRGAEGTQVRTDHPDTCTLAILVKQSNASYITGADLDGDEILDDPPTGIDATPGQVNIGIAEFGGTITTRDYLRLSGSEFVKVTGTIETDIQSLIVNDGGIPAAEVFKVESTTGNTYIFGNLGVGAGFNRFTVASNTGNTNIAGTLTTENTLKINGSTIVNQQFFTITNGGSDTVPLRTTFQIDTANGNVTMNGGNINIFGTDGTTPRLTFNNSSGDFTTYGSFSALGTGPSSFGGDLVVAGDAYINGGDLTINSDGDEIFKVSNDGSVKMAGISNYVTRTGGKKWEYISDVATTLQPNVNYFVNPTGNYLLRLPTNPLIGDTIRIIDISGNLTYNLTLVVRAPDNTNVQGVGTNTSTAMLSGVPISNFAGYDGGELVVQTPYAAFGLVYAGSTTPGGNPGVPSALTGWYLMDV